MPIFFWHFGGIMPDNGGNTIRWRRSTRCVEVNCVEVADPGTDVLMRDSKDPAGPTLGFRRDDWRAFVRAVRGGRFDPV
ncbi:DUF397 domain-containing protein [Dactylosporangium sp. CA-052675]|uniref:DUF397 domain-containing protein n=1 Tax=Dactylosporangium sp. CA-052675 TaxID=3239927 RepID=UPI003D9479EC